MKSGLAVLGGVLLACLCGCADSAKSYTRLGEWTHSPDQPMVISGSPDVDSAAYQAAGQDLTEADWRVLEKIAPRPMWERICATRQQTAQTQPAPVVRGAQAPASQPAKLPAVPTQTLPDGQIQMVYELQNLGGAGVVASQDGGAERRKITLSQPDLGRIEQMIARQLGDKGSVLALPSRNTLIITCDPAMQTPVLILLAQVDTPPRQVEITARIFEVSQDFDFQYGAKALISHIASDNRQGLASAFSAKDFVGAVVEPTTGVVPDPGSALRLMQVFTDAGLTLDATFQALADTGLIRVVSTPRLSVRAGQTAYMLAGQELPIQSAKISNDQFITEKLTFKPVGVQLYITPETIGERSVRTHIMTIVSAVSGFAPLPSLDSAQPTAPLTNPILDTREAETYVTVEDGQTLVLGGLRMIRTVTREQRVPGLGDIKGIEWLFKNHRSQRLVNDLYFFVTPRILN